MKTPILLAVALLAETTAQAAKPAAELPEVGPLQSRADRISYATAYHIASDFKRQGWTLRPEALLAGAYDASRGKPPALSESEMRLMLRLLQQRTAKPQAEQTKASATKPGSADAENQR